MGCGLGFLIQKLDEKDVPSTDRYIVVSPDIYYQLANNDKLLNRDFSILILINLTLEIKIILSLVTLINVKCC